MIGKRGARPRIRVSRKCFSHYSGVDIAVVLSLSLSPLPPSFSFSLDISDECRNDETQAEELASPMPFARTFRGMLQSPASPDKLSSQLDLEQQISRGWQRFIQRENESRPCALLLLLESRRTRNLLAAVREKYDASIKARFIRACGMIDIRRIKSISRIN